MLSLVRVKEADCVGILIAEGRYWNHLDSVTIGGISRVLGFGAHWDSALFIKSSTGHGPLILSSLELLHSLVLLNTSEIILICDSISRINPGFCITVSLS